jgi:hypothetical protein
MNEHTNIFVYSHKEFQTPDNPLYKKILDDGTLNNGTIMQNKGRAYSELNGIYYVWKNKLYDDYVGFCQYRAYFGELETIDIEKTLNETDVIIVEPYNKGDTVYDQYSKSHNINDLLLIKEIGKGKYEWFDTSWNYFIVENNALIQKNMFILKKNDFEKYCEFLFGLLFDYDKINGLTDELSYYNHIMVNYNEYIKPSYGKPSNDPVYQSRIPGFLSERIATIYFNTFFKSFTVTKLNYTKGKSDYGNY